MLKMTKIELELISNIDICYFTENEMGTGLQLINTWKIMIVLNKTNLLHI